jgi:putative transposase
MGGRLPRQLTLPKHAGWGGRRKGAGRKPSGDRAGVSHAKRPRLAGRFPVHVTLRVLAHVWNLRSWRAFRVFQRALADGSDRFGIRICEFSVQGNHVHLIAEAENAASLSRGMQGFGVRLAKGLNRLMKRVGKVLSDRFHARILRTPTEVRRAVAYVRHNRAIHRARWGERVSPPRRHAEESAEPISVRGPTYVDPRSSAAANHGVPLPKPRTYLLWRAHADSRQVQPLARE